MLGDASDAEDVLQDAYLRWHEAKHDRIEKPEAWLMTVVTRLAIDRARHARAERMSYVGSWLPEPVATGYGAHPESAVETKSDLSVAFLVLLERLGPEERAAFLLRDVFDEEYADIADAVGRTEAAARQMVHRARERVRRDQVRFEAPAEARERLLERFLAAVESADRDELLALFSDDVTFTNDGGGKAQAARRVVSGRDHVARLLVGVSTKWNGALAYHIAEINGEPAIVTMAAGRVFAVTSLATDGEKIVALYRTMNPDKLTRIGGTSRP